jgi:[ribosomal protein S5]-alanine N-acetyltransferase
MPQPFHPFPVLRTERLTLRKITDLDAKEILYLRSDGIINQYIERPEADTIKSLEAALKFIQYINSGIDKGTWITWSIQLTGQPKTIGTICLWNFSSTNPGLLEGEIGIAEVGYDLATAYQGKGFMQEAMQAVLDYGFNHLQLVQIEANTHKENMGSIKLLQRQSFVLVAELQAADRPNVTQWKRLRIP